jgi:hypothetical protein
MNYSCSDDLSLPWPGLTFHCTTKADSVDDVFLFSAAEGEKNERFYLGRDMPFLMHFGWFGTVKNGPDSIVTEALLYLQLKTHSFRPMLKI